MKQEKIIYVENREKSSCLRALNMIPKKLDYTKDECRSALRHLGLYYSKKIPNDKMIFFAKIKPKQKSNFNENLMLFLELQAYSSVVSTFRAQGSLDSNKQNVLDQLKRCFHISEDRHKAEIRRVANNEKLTTISEM